MSVGRTAGLLNHHIEAARGGKWRVAIDIVDRYGLLVAAVVFEGRYLALEDLVGEGVLADVEG